MVDQIEPSRRVSNTARESNRGRLVDVLRRQGPLPRVALARSTGLSFPAVSGLTSRLIAEELLCETETAATPWSEDGEEEEEERGRQRRKGRGKGGGGVRGGPAAGPAPAPGRRSSSPKPGISCASSRS